MSTVLLAKDYICFDARSTYESGRPFENVYGKVVIIDGFFIAVCGEVTLKRVVEWFLTGFDADKAPDVPFEISVVPVADYGELPVHRYTNECRSGWPEPLPVAMGSGGTYALGALLALEQVGRTKDAEILIGVAAKCDVFTSPEYFFVTFDASDMPVIRTEDEDYEDMTQYESVELLRELSGEHTFRPEEETEETPTGLFAWIMGHNWRKER
jgi:hypothetical protein